MDSFNISINLIVAIVLTISPHFFDTAGMKPGDLRKAYAEAQKRADYIVATGDTTDLEGMQDAAAQLALYQKEIDALTPVLHKLVPPQAMASLLVPAEPAP